MGLRGEWGKKNKKQKHVKSSSHLVVRQHRRDRVRPARQRLPQHENIGPHAVVVAAEHAPGPGQSRLDLVGYEQRAVLFQQVVGCREVARVRDDDACLALLENGSDCFIFFVLNERGGGRERERGESWKVRAKASSIFKVVRSRDVETRKKTLTSDSKDGSSSSTSSSSSFFLFFFSFFLTPHLDRLHHKRHDVRVALQRPLQRRDVVVRDVFEAGHEGPKAAEGLGVRRRRDGGEGPAPEVPLGEEDDGLVFRDALDLVAPATVGSFFVWFSVVEK